MRWGTRAARWAAVGGLVAVLGAGGFVDGLPVAEAGGGGCHSVTEEAAVRVEMLHICYTPMVLHVAPGTTVTWVNRENVPHTVTSGAYDWGSEAQLALGEEYSRRFDEAGTYPYWCIVHPGMTGVVVVDDEGTVTGAPTTRASTGSTGLPVPARAVAVFAVGAIAGVVGSRVRRRAFDGG